ncbi:hypothetical protein LCGC14_0248910 [marine sediment metagenome]|uniref:Uncharacterized protein n=1 Tax=marine sediment metagenome TaxID=412755 RepID=A0A0F9U9P4_9ZZZZ
MEFEKSCKCKAVAHTSSVVIRTTKENGSYGMDITHHPGPVCDKCKTPWRPRKMNMRVERTN